MRSVAHTYKYRLLCFASFRLDLLWVAMPDAVMNNVNEGEQTRTACLPCNKASHLTSNPWDAHCAATFVYVNSGFMPLHIYIDSFIDTHIHSRAHIYIHTYEGACVVRCLPLSPELSVFNLSCTNFDDFRCDTAVKFKFERQKIFFFQKIKLLL